MSVNSVNQELKPTNWLSVKELEDIPSVDEITVERLENMPLEKGAQLLERIYHLSQINHDLEPNFVPSNIQAYLMKRNGQKVAAPLNEILERCKQDPHFGDDEVTIFITGLPEQNSRTVQKATRKLVQAYMQRYNLQEQQKQGQRSYQNQGESKEERGSSEEDSNESAKNAPTASGNLIIVDLGATLTNFKRYAMLDIEKTGEKIGKWIVQMTNQLPYETVHIVAQGVGAHVAGAAANEFTRLTGHKLRRITALDPSKILAKKPNKLVGLSRGDAEFVDAIHTSVYGMGTPIRAGDVDFYPNGPAKGVPGSDNVVEASMRATRYFAESVRPGNERNFPAVPANSLQEYKNNNGIGKRAYMGIDTDYDLEGDYILQVNAKSPFGRVAPAQKQNTYHGVHSNAGWKNSGKDYE